MTRKNAGILLLGGFLGPLPRHEGVNHTYFTYDRALAGWAGAGAETGAGAEAGAGWAGAGAD